MGAGNVALVEVDLPTTGVARRGVCELVELDDVRDGALQERSVVADDDAPRAHAVDEAL